MRRRTQIRGGFTIVEMLVVIAVIAILLGLIVSGLTAAMNTGRKTKENNNIKQVFLAWQAYSNQFGGALLPGYLDAGTQTAWNVNYKYANGAALPAGLAQTYPWRLAPYMDHNYDVMLGYLDADTSDVDADVMREWQPPPAMPPEISAETATFGSLFAFQPAFGYNAYYVGGWYKTVGGFSRYEFLDSTWTNSTGGTSTGGLVATSESQIQRPSETMIFCSSTYRPAGTYKVETAGEDNAPGCAWVVPSFLAQTEIWRLGIGTPQGLVASQMSFVERAALMLSPAPAPQADAGTLQVFVDQGVPIRRYNHQSSVAWADGHFGSEGIGELVNMEHWTRAAWKKDFRHNP